MRTTLTIDDDLAAILKRESRRRGISYKELVNTALRRGLLAEEVMPAKQVVVTRPHAFGFKVGVDLDKLNQLSDELESEAVARQIRKQS
jgi:hypothetical protein